MIVNVTPHAQMLQYHGGRIQRKVSNQKRHVADQFNCNPHKSETKSKRNSMAKLEEIGFQCSQYNLIKAK